MLEPSSPVFAGNFDQDWGVNTYGDECLPPARQPAGGQGSKKKDNLKFEAILQDFVLLTFLVSLGFWTGLCMAKQDSSSLFEGGGFLDFAAGQAGDFNVVLLVAWGSPAASCG